MPAKGSKRKRSAAARRNGSSTLAPALRAGVRLSASDSAPQLKIEDDGRTVTGAVGYSTARASQGVKIGAWFCEARVLSPAKPGGHVRLGWMAAAGEVQAPVGYDDHSYGFRDVDGSKVHRSRRAAYGQPWKVGDVVGMMIRIAAPRARRATKDGTTLEYFVNGRSQGVAFTNLPLERYYPAVSLYNGGAARINFGPTFEYPPGEASAVEQGATDPRAFQDRASRIEAQVSVEVAEAAAVEAARKRDETLAARDWKAFSDLDDRSGNVPPSRV